MSHFAHPIKKWVSFELAEVAFMAVFAATIAGTFMGCGRETSLKGRPGQSVRIQGEALLPGTKVTAFGAVNQNPLTWAWGSELNLTHVQYRIYLCPSANQCNPHPHADINCYPESGKPHPVCHVAFRGQDGVVTSSAWVDAFDVEEEYNQRYYQVNDPALNALPAGVIPVMHKGPFPY